MGEGKGKAVPLQVWIDPEGSRRLRLPEFSGCRYMKVVRLSALNTCRLNHPRNIPGTHLCYMLGGSRDHSAARMFKSIKRLKYPIGNQINDSSACMAVPQTPAPVTDRIKIKTNSTTPHKTAFCYEDSLRNVCL